MTAMTSAMAVKLLTNEPDVTLIYLTVILMMTDLMMIMGPRRRRPMRRSLTTESSLRRRHRRWHLDLIPRGETEQGAARP